MPEVSELIPGFTPENDLERAITAELELLAGLAWGKPRKGHPEGTVGAHVADLLATIDGQGAAPHERREGAAPHQWHEGPELGASGTSGEGRAGELGQGGAADQRAQLRLITLIHDSFKYRVLEWLPKAGWNHHAGRARRFAERFTDDERILATIELHDRPYSLWRKMRRRGKLDEAAFEDMLSRIPDRELFLRFIELDGSSEGKRPEPIEWFRDELRKRDELD